MKTVSSSILNHSLFKDMAVEHQEILSQGTTELEFEPGEVIFRQGEPANRLYLIESGTVGLEATGPGEKPVVTQTLREGDMLGWSWLFPPFVWNLQARADTRCRLLALNGGHLLVTSRENVDFGYDLMKRLAPVAVQRLQATRRKLLELRQAPAASDMTALGDGSDWSKGAKGSVPTAPLDHPFFNGLSREDIQVLTGYCMQVQFKAGETIFREGDIANRFYLIESGKVVLESHLKDGAPVPIQVIGKGDVLGWSWLFPPYYWCFDARATEPTSAIFLYGTRLREDCETNHKLGLELLKRMVEVITQRLQAARRDLVKAGSVRPARSPSEASVPVNK